MVSLTFVLLFKHIGEISNKHSFRVFVKRLVNVNLEYPVVNLIFLVSLTFVLLFKHIGEISNKHSFRVFVKRLVNVNLEYPCTFNYSNTAMAIQI